MTDISARKSVIVTGSSRGIGRAVARRLASDGFAVVVNYAGNAAKAEEVVTEINSAGGGTSHCSAGRCGKCSRRGASVQGSDRHFW